MTLHIVKERDPSDENTLENFYITHKMLEMPSVHLFLAANKWDQVEVDIDNVIPRCALQFLKVQDNALKVTSIPTDITPHTVSLLTELYPERAGEIRSAYMLGKDMKEVINV